LTSSSLARSLIRILLIRPFLAPHRSLSLHSILTEYALHTAPPPWRQARKF
jgi:predicted ATPase with chaperone activity